MKGRPILAPILLVIVGVLLLLNTLDILPWSVWLDLARFWPVLLIAFGIELLLGAGRPWLSAIVGLIILVPLAVIVSIGADRWWGAVSGPTQEARVEENLDGTKRARVELVFGAGTLQLGALASDSPRLVEGDLAYRGEPPAREFKSGEAASLTISSERQRFFGLGFANRWDLRLGSTDRWDLRLTRRVPLVLEVKVGAGDLTLDLEDLAVERLNLEVGASRVEVRFPSQGTTAASIQAGVTDLTLRIPSSVGARIRADIGLSNLDIPSSRFEQRGDYYYSKNYEQSASRLDLELKTGVSNITIE